MEAFPFMENSKPHRKNFKSTFAFIRIKHSNQKKRRINLGIRGILEDRRNVYTSSTAVCRLLKIEIKDLNQADFENRGSIRNARKYKITSAHDTEFLGIALMTSAYFTFDTNVNFPK